MLDHFFGSPAETVGQIIGLIATALIVVSFQFRQNKNLFLFQLIAQFLWCVNFLLLKGWSGLAMNLEGAICCLLLLSKAHWAKSKGMLWALNAFTVALGVAFILLFPPFQWYSVLPVLGRLVGNTLFFSENSKGIRIGQICVASPCWLTYNIAVASIGGILAETFNIISSVIALLRYRKSGFQK